MSKSPIDWRSKSPVLLLNPRMPEEDRIAYERAFRAELMHREKSRLSQDLIALTTSGSGGVLKLVLLSRAAFLASAQAVNEHLDASAEDVWLKPLPDFHVGGLSIYARSFINGANVEEATVAGDSVWSASQFIKDIEEHRATLVSLVPAQVFAIAQSDLRAPSSLRAAVIGGGALAPDLYFAARRLGWPVLPSYGLTECCSQVATAALETLRVIPKTMPRPRLLSHVEVRTNKNGHLALKSAALLEGYIRITGDEHRFEDPKHEGWFETEDRVLIEGDELVIQGRDGDFLKIGGESVDFATLSLKLEELRIEWSQARAIPDVALLAVPDPRLGAVIHLVCEVGDTTGAVDQIVALFNERVLPFEKIRGIHAVPKIPRSPLGKLLKHEALKLISEQLP